MKRILLIAGLNGQLLTDTEQHFAAQGIKIYAGLAFSQITDHIRNDRVRLLIVHAEEDTIDDSLEAIHQIRAIPSGMPIIFITSHSSEARAIAALRAGVDDYFKTPVPKHSFFESISRFLGQDTIHLPAGRCRDPSKANQGVAEMIGSSQSMRSIKSYLAKLADTSTTILITGETGTGKQLAADFIHRHSQRACRPLVTVNCAALPESLAESELFGYERGAFTGAVAKRPGKFALADGGTIFLDEIGDMHPIIQAKILHTIEQKVVFPLGATGSMPINTRIIAASNQELEGLIVEGRFREDLYYRLNIARVMLPPLRDRKEDIPALTEYGIARLNKSFGREVKGLTTQAMDDLMGYDWPGNVRELMNLLEATFINLPHSKIDYAEIPGRFKPSLYRHNGHGRTERRSIVDALKKTNWNKSHAARELNWSRMTLYRKMAHHKIVAQRNPASNKV